MMTVIAKFFITQEEEIRDFFFSYFVSNHALNILQEVESYI